MNDDAWVLCSRVFVFWGSFHKDWFLPFSGEMYDESVLWQTGRKQ